MTGDPRPFVSVIVPVYNDPNGIRRCLIALGKQRYPDDRFEVLVVDNGSTDQTRDVIREFPVTLLVEDEIQGSYAARNRGIQHAEGAVLAFVDADCTPDPEWIEAGVEAIVNTEADLASGRVSFVLSPERTAAERYDALVNMRNDRKVEDGVGKTANLFVRPSVFEKIGSFPSSLQSGGDVYWTKAATSDGHKLVYTPDAAVEHPSRNLSALVRKMYRVGKGSVRIWALNEETTAFAVALGLVRFPLKAFRFLRSERNEGSSAETPRDRNVEMTVGVYFVAALSLSALMLGRLVGMWTLYFSPSNPQ